jgi:hypothetical protein
MEKEKENTNNFLPRFLSPGPDWPNRPSIRALRALLTLSL